VVQAARIATASEQPVGVELSGGGFGGASMADVVALWKGVFMPRPSRGG
jgi:hypothetical protein